MWYLNPFLHILKHFFLYTVVFFSQSAYDEEAVAGVHGDDDDSDDSDDDDMSSFQGEHGDECESTDEEPDLRELKSRGLEWDESDLSKYQCKV